MNLKNNKIYCQKYNKFLKIINKHKLAIERKLTDMLMIKIFVNSNLKYSQNIPKLIIQYQNYKKIILLHINKKWKINQKIKI